MVSADEVRRGHCDDDVAQLLAAGWASFKAIERRMTKAHVRFQVLFKVNLKAI